MDNNLSNKRFVRWQKNTMAQFSTALSLFSALSAAALGFLMSLLLEKIFAPLGSNATLYIVALLAYLISSIVGVGAIITRLLDFRLTAQKVRNGKVEEPLTYFGTDASDYGKATWRLFWILVISFSVAVIVTFIFVLNYYLKSIVGAATIILVS